MHISHPATATTTLYSAPVIFDRNAQNVPAVVRVADIMWAAAQISGMYSQSSIAPPMSVHSLSLELVDRVRGWDCGAEAIGEDMHMFLKCFFALNGHLTARTILSPVSQCNVTGGGRSKGLSRATKDVRARYRQALRHMWGALDLGYLLRKTAETWHGRKRTLRAWRPLHSSLNYIPGANALECTAIMVDPSLVPESGIFSDCVTDTLGSPHYERIFYLFYRMFEAHFLPLQMTILVCASSLYSMVADPGLDSHNIAWIFPVCTGLRTLGFLEMVVYLGFYERFHNMCVKAREREMSDAGLSEGMHFSHRSRRANWIDYLLVPLVAPLYVAIPSAVALTCHFWTLDLVYTVSKKATRKRGNSCSLLKGDCMV